MQLPIWLILRESDRGRAVLAELVRLGLLDPDQFRKQPGGAIFLTREQAEWQMKTPPGYPEDHSKILAKEE